MDQDKLTNILNELELRYGMDKAFTDKVRPVAEKILDPSIPDEVRSLLLTELAALYQSQAKIQQSCAQLCEALNKSLMDQLQGILDQENNREDGKPK